MLFVDPRAGSKELVAPLQSLNVPVNTQTLAFGDVSLIGRGPENRPVTVGVEYKRLGDLLQSLNDKRLTAHQLPGMLEMYEVPVLLVEGIYSADERGHVIEWRKDRWQEPHGAAWSYSTLAERLYTLYMRAGIEVVNVPDLRASAAWLAGLHKWWVGKPYEAHGSHKALRLKTLYDPDPLKDFTITRKMKVVASLADGIGPEKARAVADAFPAPKDILNAEKEQLEQVKGIGKVLADRIWAESRRVG